MEITYRPSASRRFSDRNIRYGQEGKNNIGGEFHD